MTTMNEFSAHDAFTFERIVTEAHAFRAAIIAGAFATVGRKLGQGIGKLVAAQKRRAAAAHLLAMDDRMLRDIGLTRAQVPLVVGGLTTGEAPAALASVQPAPLAFEANENTRRRAA